LRHVQEEMPLQLKFPTSKNILKDPLEHGYAIGGYEEEIENHHSSSSSSEYGNDLDGSSVLPPTHTIDIPSVRRPPVPVMVPAD